ncbi:MAG: glyceraldehyde dehydrogenase subunit beta [Thermoprotei archaeon]
MGFPPEFGYYRPSSLQDALRFLELYEAKPLAGGQSLIPMLKFRLIRPKYLVDLNPLKEMDYVVREEDKVKVGAMTRHYELVKSGLVRNDLPLLQRAASKVGDMQVRNMGTIGGSISHADPAANYPPVLLAYDAEIKIASSKGERVVKARDFFKGPYTTDLKEGELVVEVSFPVLKGYKYEYEKVVRRAGDFALAGMAVLAKVSDKVEDLRVAYTGVHDMAYRPYELEKDLLDKRPSADAIQRFAEAVSKEVNPPSDNRGSSEYRRKVVRVMTVKVLKGVLGVVG